MPQASEQKLAFQVDRKAIRDVLTDLHKVQGQQDWCVACGAGAASAKLDYPGEVVQSLGKQLVESGKLQEFITSLRNLPPGENDWCVACGAAAASSPIGRIGNPADLPDSAIDEIARKLISAVKVG